MAKGNRLGFSISVRRNQARARAIDLTKWFTVFAAAALAALLITMITASDSHAKAADPKKPVPAPGAPEAPTTANYATDVNFCQSACGTTPSLQQDILSSDSKSVTYECLCATSDADPKATCVVAKIEGGEAKHSNDSDCSKSKTLNSQRKAIVEKGKNAADEKKKAEVAKKKAEEDEKKKQAEAAKVKPLTTIEAQDLCNAAAKDKSFDTHSEIGDAPTDPKGMQQVTCTFKKGGVDPKQWFCKTLQVSLETRKDGANSDTCPASFEKERADAIAAKDDKEKKDKEAKIAKDKQDSNAAPVPVIGADKKTAAADSRKSQSKDEDQANYYDALAKKIPEDATGDKKRERDFLVASASEARDKATLDGAKAEKADADRRVQVAESYQTESGALAKIDKDKNADAFTAQKAKVDGIQSQATELNISKEQLDEKGLTTLRSQASSAGANVTSAESQLKASSGERAKTESIAKAGGTDTDALKKNSESGGGPELAHEQGNGKNDKNGAAKDGEEAGDEGKGNSAKKSDVADAKGGKGGGKANTGIGHPDGQADGKIGQKKNIKNGEVVTDVTSDDCKHTIMVIMTKEAAQEAAKKLGRTPSPEEVAQHINSKDYADRKSEIESDYGCSAQKGRTEFMAGTDMMINTGLQVTASVAAGVAQGRTQQAFQDSNGDFGATNKAALENMGDTLENTGKAQVAAGAAQALISIYGWKVGSNQKANMAKLKQTGNSATEVGDGTSDEKNHEANTYTANGLAVEVEKVKRGSAEKGNEEGLAQYKSAMEAHKETKAAGDQLFAQSLQHALINAASGAANISAGRAMKDQAKLLGQPNPELPTQELPPGVDDGNVNDTPPPPVVSGGAVDNSEDNFIAEGEKKQEEVKPLGNVGGPLIGSGASGGLKDGVRGGNGGGFVGPATGGGGAGGAASLAGGGGGGAPSGGDKPAGADSVVGAGSGKFEGGSGGIAFGGGGAGGGKKDEGTGMDINGLLSQFMPKKDGEDGARGPNILEYTKDGKPGEGRGLASDGEGQGGVLGRNGDIFNRAHTPFVEHYMKYYMNK